jgi:Cu2+-exporting ATPase
MMEHQTGGPVAEHSGHRASHAGHADHADHAAQFRERFWLSLVLSVPVVAFSAMFADLIGYTLPAGTGWISPLFGVVTFGYGGVPFLKGAAHEVRTRRPGMMLLIGLAITVAFVASLATSFHVSSFDLDFWWELALLIDVMLLGHWLEMKAVGQAQGALTALAALLPDDAERVTDSGAVETVGIDALRPGDVVLVRSGGRVPADGEIVDGEAEVDESMITGESRPVPKRAGDRVVAGTVSTDSAIRVRVTAVGDDTALAGIQRLVAEAQASRSRAQALADRAAALLFYVATTSAAVTFVVWMLLGDTNMAVESTVTVLVSARARTRDPSRHRDFDGGKRPGRDSRKGPARAGTHAPRRCDLVRQDGHAHPRRTRRHRCRHSRCHRRRVAVARRRGRVR